MYEERVGKWFSYYWYVVDSDWLYVVDIYWILTSFYWDLYHFDYVFFWIDTSEASRTYFFHLRPWKASQMTSVFMIWLADVLILFYIMAIAITPIWLTLALFMISPGVSRGNAYEFPKLQRDFMAERKRKERERDYIGWRVPRVLPC